MLSANSNYFPISVSIKILKTSYLDFKPAKSSFLHTSVLERRLSNTSKYKCII